MEIVKLNIPDADRWTDDYLFQFCMANSDLNIERDNLGTIYIMSPVGGLSSIFSGKMFFIIEKWNQESNAGVTFDSSGGFILPDTSMKTPDVAWVSNNIWQKLSQKQQTQFPPICPEVVVEVKSHSDRLPVLMQKMESWTQNGVMLGWLVDPKTKKAWVYSPEIPRGQLLSDSAQLDGGKVLPGFSYSLQELFSQV